MEAISTLENIRPPVVSRWSQKVNNCLRLQCQNILLYIIIEYSLTIWNIANVHVIKHNSVYNYLGGGGKLRGWGNVSVWGVFCISSTVGNIIYL